MARKQRTVVEVQCDRCSRIEEVDGDSKAVPTSFEGRMFDLSIRFEDLCTPCTRTVKNHLEAIGKKLDGVSPDRVAKYAEEEAPISEKKLGAKKVASPGKGDAAS